MSKINDPMGILNRLPTMFMLYFIDKIREKFGNNPVTIHLKDRKIAFQPDIIDMNQAYQPGQSNQPNPSYPDTPSLLNGFPVRELKVITDYLKSQFGDVPHLITLGNEAVLIPGYQLTTERPVQSLILMEKIYDPFSILTAIDPMDHKLIYDISRCNFGDVSFTIAFVESKMMMYPGIIEFPSIPIRISDQGIPIHLEGTQIGKLKVNRQQVFRLGQPMENKTTFDERKPEQNTPQVNIIPLVKQLETNPRPSQILKTNSPMFSLRRQREICIEFSLQKEKSQLVEKPDQEESDHGESDQEESDHGESDHEESDQKENNVQNLSLPISEVQKCQGRNCLLGVQAPRKQLLCSRNCFISSKDKSDNGKLFCRCPSDDETPAMQEKLKFCISCKRDLCRKCMKVGGEKDRSMKMDIDHLFKRVNPMFIRNYQRTGFGLLNIPVNHPDFCIQCSLKITGKALREYINEHGPVDFCECGKQAPEANREYSVYFMGTPGNTGKTEKFFRSVCYSCEPLGIGESKITKPIADEILEYVDKLNSQS